MRWLLAGVALIALVQAVIWIGQPAASTTQRLLGVFAAPVAVLLLAVALAAGSVPELLF